MSYVKTPMGVVLHIDNHRAAVELAKKHDLQGQLLMLEPAEPVDPMELFRGIDLQAGEPLKYETTPLTVETIERGVAEMLKLPPDQVEVCHPDEACPTCHVRLVPEHAHQRCPKCGYRDSCCF